MRPMRSLGLAGGLHLIGTPGNDRRASAGATLAAVVELSRADLDELVEEAPW
jgi:hypothetical protein